MIDVEPVDNVNPCNHVVGNFGVKMQRRHEEKRPSFVLVRGNFARIASK